MCLRWALTFPLAVTIYFAAGGNVTLLDLVPIYFRSSLFSLPPVVRPVGGPGRRLADQGPALRTRHVSDGVVMRLSFQRARRPSGSVPIPATQRGNSAVIDSSTTPNITR